MGLELYPSSEKSMISSQDSILGNSREDYKKEEMALQCFVDDTSLKGSAYKSAKTLASRAAIPAVRGAAVICSAMENSNSSVSSCLGGYTWGGSSHLSEEKLRSQAAQISSSIRYLSGLENAGLYSSSINSLREVRNSYQKRISEMHSYNSQTANAYSQAQNIETIKSAVNDAVAAMASASFSSSSGYSLQGIDWSFEKTLSEVDSLLTDAEHHAISFYNGLLPALKAGISIEDIEATKDGFVMCTKPMDQVLKDIGIDDFYEAYFSEMHLWGLRKPDGTFEHSIIRILVPSLDTPQAVVLVPFRALDMSVFDNPTNALVERIEDEFRRVMDSENTNGTSDFLLDYFRDPNSEGSYLIADIVIGKALESFDDGVWNPGTMGMVVDGDPFTSAALEKYQKMGIADIGSGTIRVNDPNNLTFDEKSAILACITSNPDLYSYAAENQFHADYFALAGFPVLGDYIGKRAVVSDAGVGESAIYFEPAFKISSDDEQWGKFIRSLGNTITPGISTNYYDQQVSAKTSKGEGGRFNNSTGGDGFGGGGGGGAR